MAKTTRRISCPFAVGHHVERDYPGPGISGRDHRFATVVAIRDEWPTTGLINAHQVIEVAYPNGKRAIQPWLGWHILVEAK